MRFAPALGFCALVLSTTPAGAQMERAPSLAAPNSVFLEDLTWVEVGDAIAAGRTTVIIPTGGTEQNDPIMALGKANDGQGHMGDPRYSTAAIGKLILEAQVQDGANQIRKLRVNSR